MQIIFSKKEGFFSDIRLRKNYALKFAGSAEVC